LPAPPRRNASSPREAEAVAEEIGRPFAVKAQFHAPCSKPALADWWATTAGPRRHDLRLVGLALVVTSAGAIPVSRRTDPARTAEVPRLGAGSSAGRRSPSRDKEAA